MEMNAHTRLWLTIFLGVMTAIAPLSTDMYLPALPEVQEAFSVPTSLVQMTLTMTTLGMALGQILAGPLSDLLGRRKPLLIGMLVFVGATLGCVLAQNIRAHTVLFHTHDGQRICPHYCARDRRTDSSFCELARHFRFIDTHRRSIGRCNSRLSRDAPQGTAQQEHDGFSEEIPPPFT